MSRLNRTVHPFVYGVWKRHYRAQSQSMFSLKLRLRFCLLFEAGYLLLEAGYLTPLCRPYDYTTSNSQLNGPHVRSVELGHVT